MTPHQSLTWIEGATAHAAQHLMPLIDLRLPTPAGFVIDGSYIESALYTPQMRDRLMTLITSASSDDVVSLDRVREQIVRLMLDSRAARHMVRDIGAMYSSLLGHEHMVQQDSYPSVARAAHLMTYIYRPPTVEVSTLPVPEVTEMAAGETSLIEAIKRTVAESLALGVHRRVHTVPTLLVRRLPQAQSCGYVLTSDIARHDTTSAVIQAYHGAVMLDQIKDLYLVTKSTLTITSRLIQTQGYRMSLRSGAYTQVDMHEAPGSAPVLTDDQIQRLADMARQIEKKLYFPHRFDWVIERGQIYLTKLRKL